jgi:hypothetical protein
LLPPPANRKTLERDEEGQEREKEKEKMASRRFNSINLSSFLLSLTNQNQPLLGLGRALEPPRHLGHQVDRRDLGELLGGHVWKRVLFYFEERKREEAEVSSKRESGFLFFRSLRLFRFSFCKKGEFSLFFFSSFTRSSRRRCR